MLETIEGMKRYTITRLIYQDEQTLGYLWDGLKKIACTLELEWDDNKSRVSCIPKGIYTVVTRHSPKFGNHFHILDVPNRDYILIHSGNYHRDILGCVLVGAAHIDIDGDGYMDVTSSKNKMRKLNEILPTKFELEII